MRKFLVTRTTGMLGILAPGIAGVAVRPVRRVLLSGCAASTMVLGALALSSGAADASNSPTTLHYFQKETKLTFYNTSGQVIEGYPPVGGHVREDDVDYVGNHSHHAKHWSATDHLYCNVVSAPATADCFTEFATTGGSLIYCGQPHRQPGELGHPRHRRRNRNLRGLLRDIFECHHREQQ